MSDRRSLVTWVVVALLVATALAMPVAMGAGNESSPSGEDWTLDELQKQGEITDSRYPSLRVAGSMNAFWLVHYPPQGMGSYGSPNNKEFITPSSTVNRNKVRLYATHPFDGRNRTYNLTVIYWRADSRKVQTQNGTTTERFANVTAVGQQEVSFDAGMRRHAEVLLRGHYEKPTRVTILLDHPSAGTLRWQFRHKSVPTAQSAGISSKGDLYEHIFIFVVLPSLVIAYIVGKKVPKYRRKALAGPGRGPMTWIALGGLFAVIAYFAGYYATASLVVSIPFVFPLLVGWVVGAIQIEDDEDAVEEWGFIRLDPETATSPLEDKAEILDSGTIEIEGYDIVHNEDNEPVLYEKGLLNMWARYKDCYAPLNIDNKEAEWEGIGDYDKVIVIDQDSEDLIEHVPERVLFKWPWRTYQPPTTEDGEIDWEEYDYLKARALPRKLDRSAYLKSAIVLAVPVVAGFASQQFLGAWQWGPLATLPLALLLAEPIEGEAEAHVAPGQARKAWTTAWYLDLNVRRFGTIDQVLSALVESENKKYDAEEWLQDLREEGLIEEAHNREGKPFETVLSDDDPAVEESTNGADACAEADD